LFKVKKIKGLCGDVLEYVACLPCRHRQAQTRPMFDEEIGQKDHFRMEKSNRHAVFLHQRILKSAGREFLVE
jgi:hypothetical protein